MEEVDDAWEGGRSIGLYKEEKITMKVIKNESYI